MKKISFTILCLCLALPVFAGTYDDLNEEFCPNFTVEEDVAYCDVEGADVVSAAKVGSKVQLEAGALFPGDMNVSAIDMGLLPDDSTSGLYTFVKNLVGKNNKPVGFISYEGYHNSEMESRWQLVTRFNLKGKMVSIELSDWN